MSDKVEVNNSGMGVASVLIGAALVIAGLAMYFGSK